MPSVAFAAVLASRALARARRLWAGLNVGIWELAVVVTCCAAVVWWLSPADLLSGTTPTGGDTAAHVWAPAFLQDELLPNWQIRGWTTDWYGGFPAFHFYMVLPFLAMVLLNVVLPYGVAFKLVAVSGVVLMPAAAWLMGRLMRLRAPVPQLLAVGALLFVFDPNHTIFGGNIASTLAGEFSFSIALAVCLVYLGLFWRSLEDGTGRAPAAVALAVVALCHPIVLGFAVGVSVVVLTVRALESTRRRAQPVTFWTSTICAVALVIAAWAFSGSVVASLGVLLLGAAVVLALEFRRTLWALSIGLIGGALSAWWTVPFLWRRTYLNDMGWERVSNYTERLFSPAYDGGAPFGWLLALAVLAAVVGFIRWHRPTVTWVAVAVCAAALFVLWPQNRLYNARILPFWYLAVHLLAAIGVWRLVAAVSSLLRTERTAAGAVSRARWRWVSAKVLTAPVACLLAIGYVGLYLGSLPGGGTVADGHYGWGPLRVDSEDKNFSAGWAAWNHGGLEEKSEFGEYTSLVNAVADVGEEVGCGTLLWEYEKEHLDRYGSPMTPMLIPHFTDSCVGSSEGLYFESSQSVAFHFLMQSELSVSPSRSMRDLPYSDLNFELGVPHMRMSGIRYYAAFTPAAITAADAADGLTPLRSVPPWKIYRVDGAAVVEPLRFEPAVANFVPTDGRGFVEPAVNWFADPAVWDVPVATEGPAAWQRVGFDESSRSFEAGERRSLPVANVSNVQLDGGHISFTVDRPGVPVLVRASYFPNWQASGADGPYRVTPNQMVVVPTEGQVTLSYAATPAEWTGWLLTLAGLVVLAMVALSKPAQLDARALRRRTVPWAARLAALAENQRLAAPKENQQLAALEAQQQSAALQSTQRQPGFEAAAPSPSSPGRSDEAQPPAPLGQQDEAETSIHRGTTDETLLPPQPGEVARSEPSASPAPRVSVILPAYNAESQVASAITRVREALGGALGGSGSGEQPATVEVVVVDDGSTDGTAEAAQSGGADVVLSHLTNRGKGAAVRTGMAAASGSTRVFTDVDLAYEPAQIARLVAAIEAGADVAIGDRTLSDSTRTEPASRAAGSRLFSAITRRMLLEGFRDTQCGLKGFTAPAAQALFSQAQVDGFAFDVEVLWLAQAWEMDIQRVPVEVTATPHSTISGLRDAVAMLCDLHRIRRRVARGAYDLDVASAADADIATNAATETGSQADDDPDAGTDSAREPSSTP